ncbi:hypothetical protein INT43_008047 [Umbelopsis isabellina]|uniref:Protein kinase domain-containing protein n=1 Tax=Mortierella isabellina TaxID=91625 RepID=A0A8H7U893_MORIS|nr:hypothetical protein INT43_008047 [Umbelopsis isabellina]
MFRQIGTPSERDLTELMGDDYIREWDQEKVTHWLEEHNWGHIAPKFRVETLPRPITTYADRRRLLNEIRAIGRPADVPYNQRIRDPNIHIDTNLPLMVSPATNSSSSGSQSPVRAHTPLSAHLSDTSPVTPSSLSRMTAQSQYDTQYEDHASSPDSPVSKSKFRNSPSSHSSSWSMFSKLKNSHYQSPKIDSSASAVPIISSPTLTDSEVDDYAKIAPFIPSRTSSTPDKISKILGSTATNFIGYNVPPKLVGKTAANSQKGLPKSASYQPSYTRIPKRHAHTVMTDLHDPMLVKESILKKMGLKGDPDRYVYFHENGPDPDVPLQPQHLIHLCRMADYSAANRILVKPAKQPSFAYLQDQIWNNFVNSSAEQKQMGISGPQTHDESDHSNSNRPPYGFATPDLGASPSPPRRNQKLKEAYSPPYSRASYLHPTATPAVYHHNATDSTFDTTQSNDYPYDSNASNASDLYVSPAGFEHKGVQLSDPPTPQNYTDLQDNERYGDFSSAGGDSLFDNTFDSSFISPTSQFKSNEIAERFRTTSAGSNKDHSESSTGQKAPPCVNFWAVQPQSVKPAPSDTSIRQPLVRLSLSESAVPQQRSDIPKIVTRDVSGPSGPVSSSTSGSPISPLENPAFLRLPNQQPDKFWGERPPVELMQQYLDKYFAGHDLDKEIIVETPANENGNNRNSASNLARQQPLRHKKSIRVVAKEASKKWLKDGHEYAPTGNMLRRKSTKMWGQRVVQVKPGQQPADTPTVERATGYFGKSDAPVCTKMQWIRGALIGKGSFGRVYHALNVAAGDFIAVKQVDIPKTSSDLLSVQQKETVESLYQEITLLKDLDHEHVVEYLGYDHDETEGMINIFLEYVSGGSISSRLARHGAFEEPVVRHFTRQILLGLEYLHDRKILHRDIKGANILVEQDGICKISDFGLSKKNDYENPYDQNSHMSLRVTNQNTIINRMAPEMVKSEAYSAKVDIWSTGCTVIEMFTGQRPWLAMNQLAALYNLGHYNKPPLPDNISEEAREFLDLCLTIDPDKRPTAADLLAHPFCRLDPNFQFTDYVSSGKI